MGRQAAMANINAALAQPAAPPSSSSGGGSSAPSAPHAAPGITAPTPLTADEKRGFDAARITRLDDEKRTGQQRKDDEKRAAQLAQQQADALQQGLTQQQADQDIFDQTSSAAVNSAKKIAHGAGVKIERLPTPGSIMLPLVILLVFFFLLIPVNGHTRIQWLWLVITGNADIVGAAASGDFASPTGTDSSASGDISDSSNAANNIGGSSSNGASTMLIPNFSFGSLMTGVEDI